MIDLKQKAEELRRKRLAREQHILTQEEQEEQTLRWYFAACMIPILLIFLSVPVYAGGTAATGDPVTTINNLSTFIFGAIRAIGIILLGFGIVQIGLSLKGHDASQRANGFMTFFGGVIITFAKNILDLILK